jgi:hypothetical protein
MPRKQDLLTALEAQIQRSQDRIEADKKAKRILEVQMRAVERKQRATRRYEMGKVLDEAGLGDLSPTLLVHLCDIIGQLRQQTPNQLGLWIDDGLARLKEPTEQS